MVKGPQGKLPIYDNPPLVELVIGARFAKLEAFKVPHFGLFWNSIIDEFPRCEEAAPYATEAAELETNLPLPRVWLINAADDHLLQMQKDLFLLNWRQKEGTYPHFDAIKSMYDRYFSNFNNFLADNSIGPADIKSYELTYIDHINQGEGWDKLADIGKVFPNLAWHNDNPKFLNDPKGFSTNTLFLIPGDTGTMTVKISSGRRVSDNREIILLDMTARSKPGLVTDDGMSNWFSAAHDFIVRSFRELCGEEIQTTFWKRRDA
jgi:uncharacterized protein (TIGR04255 family)